jgi:hypothetical protein
VADNGIFKAPEWEKDVTGIVSNAPDQMALKIFVNHRPDEFSGTKITPSK